MAGVLVSPKAFQVPHHALHLPRAPAEGARVQQGDHRILRHAPPCRAEVHTKRGQGKRHCSRAHNATWKQWSI